MNVLPKFLTATEARQQLATGTLSCEALVRQCFARIDEREAVVDAWQFLGREAAIAQAQALDKSSSKGLLRGIPMGVKDIIDVAGMPTRNGSMIFADAHKASMDAASVAMARMAGAIPFGKTVTTELAGFTPGRTRNPRNLEHTPGGSSSGSAAAVADGHVPLAIGTQTSGSVIRPAAYCGVFGFKPSFGLIPRGGVKLQSDTLDTVGVFARSVDDLALWYAAMTGARATFLDQPSYPNSHQNSHQNSRSLRINIITRLLDHADMEMGVTVAEASDVLSTAGVKIRDIKLPAIFDDAEADQRLIQLSEMARHYAWEHAEYRDLLSPQLANALDEGARISKEAYRQAMQRSDVLRKQADNLFGDCDAWLMPAAPGGAPKGLDATGDPVFNRLPTLLHQPAINVPHYQTKAGLPLGLQLVGMRHQDEKLLNVARQVQALLKAHQDVY